LAQKVIGSSILAFGVYIAHKGCWIIAMSPDFQSIWIADEIFGRFLMLSRMII